MINVELHHAATIGVEVGATSTDSFDNQKLIRNAVVREKLMRIAAQGITAKRAAQLVGISRERVNEIYRDPMFRAGVRRVLERSLGRMDTVVDEKAMSLQDRIAKAGTVAFELLLETLEDENADRKLRVQVAEGLLDRNPEASRHTASTVTNNHRFSVEDLMHAAKTSEELMSANVIPISKAG